MLSAGRGTGGLKFLIDQTWAVANFSRFSRRDEFHLNLVGHGLDGD